MKNIAGLLALTILFSGCMGGDTTVSSTTLAIPPSTLISETTTTSTIVITTSTMILTTTLPVLADCDSKPVDDWRTFCYDDYARAHNDVSYCKSVLCYAFLAGDNSTCEGDYTCIALSRRDPKVCNDIYQSNLCKEWYAYETNDIALCRTLNGLGYEPDGCYGSWSDMRGDTSYCVKLNTMNQRDDCQAGYWMTIAGEKQDRTFCDNIKNGMYRTRCIEWVNTVKNLQNETSPLRHLDIQLKPKNASVMPGV